MTVEDEKKMTLKCYHKCKKDYPRLNNAEMQNYVTGIGKKLARTNNLEGNPYNYNFTVVDVNYVNAFAFLAGTIFVTAPLLAMAENEAELAGVLGHEIGHVKARHTAERIEQTKREQGKSAIYAACGGLLIQKYKFMANSREDEMEADRISFKTAVGAGYNKDAVGGFYSKLLSKEQKSKSSPMLASLNDVMSMHPPSQERVNQVSQMANDTPVKVGSLTNTNDFVKIKVMAQKITAEKKS